MTDERRKFPRYSISQMIAINFNNLNNITYAKGINISQSGLLCDINYHLSIKTNIYLVLSIPTGNDEKKIEIQARVVRAEKTESNNIFRTALEFTFIEENNKNFLNKYIAGLE